MSTASPTARPLREVGAKLGAATAAVHHQNTGSAGGGSLSRMQSDAIGASFVKNVDVKKWRGAGRHSCETRQSAAAPPSFKRRSALQQHHRVLP